MNAKCHKCGKHLESYEGVNCGNYDLCEECYENHTPRVDITEENNDAGEYDLD